MTGDDAGWGTTTGALVELVERSSVPMLAADTLLGERFRILGQIGAGGMGVVYRARDEKLSRDVAIKVHARQSGAERLEREATAMAQLSHPNVVVVHEVGTHQGAVFIAMELVDGENARVWRTRAARGWRQVVRVYLAAGEGMWALHQAGLIHRDFKPDNVLVGSDGRVRVADLGLARAPGGGGGGTSDKDSGNAATGMAGTPAYMAPEQRTGKGVDARSDQYAFAASLSEALRDLRPPLRVRRALARGCAIDPAARWPTLRALLDRVAFDPRPRVVTALLLAVTTAAVVFSLAAAHRRAPCRGGDDRFARAWSPTIKATVRAALTAAGLPAPSDWTLTENALDQYQRRWVDMYTSACQATRVRGDQSEDLLDRRMVCLESRLDETAALTALLAHADGALAERAVGAAQSITPVDGCGDVAALTAVLPLPTDPVVRAQVTKVRKQLDETKALDKVGRFTEAKVKYEEALVQARRIDYLPLIAEAAMSLSIIQEGNGAYKEAEANARDAAYAAEASHDDDIGAQAWVHLVYIVGNLNARLAEGRELARMAGAALKRLPRPNRDLEAGLLDWQATMLGFEHRRAEALVLEEQALAIRRALFGERDMRTPQQMFNLGVTLMSQDGSQTKDLERALSLFREGLAIDERLLGPDHPDDAHFHVGIAEALKYLGRFDEAEPVYGRALAIAEKTHGSVHVLVGQILIAHGGNRSSLGDCAGAAALFEEARPVVQSTMGENHIPLAILESFLAAVQVQCKRFGDAVPNAQHALAILANQDANDANGQTYATLGSAQLGLGRKQDALASFTRALELASKPDVSPFTLATARFGLARALPTGQRARAIDLAQQARTQFATLPVHYHRERDEVDAWLAAQ